MEARVVNNLSPAAAHDGAVRCLLAIELSKKSWVVAVNRPLLDKINLYKLKPCDWKGLLQLIERIRKRVSEELKKPVEVISCSKLAMTASGFTACSKPTACTTT